MRPRSFWKAKLTRARIALLAGSALALLPAVAHAAEPSDEATDGWDRKKTRLRAVEYALVPALGAAMLTTGLAAQGSVSPAWTGRNAFDDGARDLLRGRSRATRRTAGITSDALWIGLTLYPAAVESLLLAGIVHGKSAIAFDLFMIYGESALSAGVLTVLAEGLAYRARPLASACEGDAAYDPMCGTTQLSRSFFAGHAAAAFNSAALTCLNGAELPLYGSRAASIAACAGTMALATTTGVLRIVADKHWASDVLVGSATGVATGLLVPWLLHYGRVRRATASWTVVPVFTAEVRGVSIGIPM
jgi:membrane-associated phospholipid phosphatase